ncbi:ABC-type multidrug transport system, permease component [Dissulfuribacter thermophilus]|uniref:Transport permease protein n=1 Tax=Dissulfuribacter thermophilus TaxID=1156395 RepID=A0A1B9F6U2_9BACT|nr:ABC transporter permease [Dissulfuribacter thermophilus]OCC15626.1 ABC-type multidrug transport system, permease component [Dissulfuribacter thermophilus]
MNLSGEIRKAAAFLLRDLQLAMGYPLKFASQLVGILASTFMFYYISRLVDQNGSGSLAAYGGNYFPFLLVGIALSDYLMFSINALSNEVRKAQVIGTFEAILVTPTHPSLILFSSCLYSFLFTSVRILFYFLAGTVLFGVRFPPISLSALTVSLILTILPFLGIGLLSAAIIIVFKQGNPLTWIFGSFSGLLSGVFYPVSVLPHWLQPFAAFIPLTYGLDAVRKVLLTGAGILEVSHQLLVLLFFSIVFLGVGLAAVAYALKIARKDGTLLYY